MSLKDQFVSFVFILCLPIIYTHSENYPIIDPSKEISVVFQKVC